MPKRKIILSSKNESKIQDFETFLKSNGKRNPDTLRAYTSSVRAVLNLINKDYNKIAKQDIINAFATDKYSNSSLEIIKQKFSHFLDFIGKSKLKEHISFNHKALNTSKYDEDDILKPDEIKALIDTPKDLYDRALLELLISSGGRKREIRELKYKNIKIDNNGIIWLNVNGKTGKRQIPLVHNEEIASALPLENFLQFYRSHKYKNNPDNYFFYSTSNDPKYRDKPICKMTPNNKLTRFSKEAKINRHITPHLLRHTSATYDGLFLSNQRMCLKYGWKRNSRQLLRYCHTDVKLHAEQLLREAGKTPEYIEQHSKCPRCKQDIHYTDKICPHCNKILDLEMQDKIIFEKEKEIEQHKKVQAKIPKLESEISELRKELKTIKQALHTWEIEFPSKKETVTLKFDKNKNPIHTPPIEYKKEKVSNKSL